MWVIENLGRRPPTRRLKGPAHRLGAAKSSRSLGIFKEQDRHYDEDSHVHRTGLFSYGFKKEPNFAMKLALGLDVQTNAKGENSGPRARWCARGVLWEPGNFQDGSCGWRRWSGSSTTCLPEALSGAAPPSLRASYSAPATACRARGVRACRGRALVEASRCATLCGARRGAVLPVGALVPSRFFGLGQKKSSKSMQR